MPRQLVNALLFQLGWFICVLSGDSLWLLLGVAILLAHLHWIGRWADEGPMIVGIALIGIALDSFLSWLGVFQFQQVSLLVPLWLMLLWALLAITLRHGLAWSARPWWLGCVLGALGGPLSYYAGGRLAGVTFPYGTGPTLLGLGLLWALLLPLLHVLARPAPQEPPLVTGD
ncbi:DUF2878 domain-containing protein [Pseudomonas protegens]|jgi:succinate-acetate transporter protein|uniref:DUF2878 domain-containing protein n=3 Tax=Pseudomonas protegens TaxID=380021 RepID=A0ABY2VJN2_9PSED|nr:DUF2878 domain-containing protein [Pseudomonas protegens]AAY94375.1 putative membrane protein [Pseudomonas protegens Pf-5]ASE21455.1 DUF2878 domain-containing protein [Pseudomonas protegens]QEZ54868.1 DUF2878 domain-containing protein [Pseudomonas protegens]QEZ58934.1 DUF2878 domain-containing protein [Pseudomonas protegens]QEZ66152.1 DUF2878 domain-containing protein [Pseudomonas protegens]